MIIKSPIITEKSIQKYKDENKVTFEVDVNADRKKASKAVSEAYGVEVVDARSLSRLGKVKRRQNGKYVRKSDKKIMVFKLKKGDKIDLFNQ